ncbi:MAG: hydrogen peroxide-inducible genes activator [Planctomycetes bacterium]|nr:hydrogen peroxide-inducible genes activator [Planctomycetota bacterium]
MRPTITQLEYFVAVARRLSFRGAAEEVHATQPAISAQIQKLEAIWKVQLFERDRRRVLLTPIGERLAEASKKLLAELDDLSALTQATKATLQGSLRLGVIPTVAPYVLPRVFDALRDAHPDLALAVREGPTQLLLRMLREGELDLLLLAIDVDLGSVETLALFDDAFLAVLPKKHALARKREVSLEAFSAEDVLLLDEGHCLSLQAQDLCRRAGSSSRFDLRATSLVTLVQLVGAGQGVTLIPEMAQSDLGRTPGIALRAFAKPTPSRRIGLAWRSGSPRAQAFRALGELIEARTRPESDS